VGIALYCGVMVAFFPTIRGSESYAAALEDYPDALKELFGGDTGFELTTASGYLNAQLFSLVLPILLSIVAIGAAAQLGAEEERGLVDLVLSNPIRRRRLVLERALGMGIIVFILSAVILATLGVVGAMVDLDLPFQNMLAATATTSLLVLLHGFLALAVAAGSGRRGPAVAAATVALAVGYVLNALAALVDWMEPARFATPWHYATGNTPLVNGWSPESIVALAVPALAFVALSVMFFERRDLS